MNYKKIEKILKEYSLGKNTNVSWKEFVKLHIPGIINEEVEYILREHTAFPLANARVVSRQIKEYIDKERII